MVCSETKTKEETSFHEAEIQSSTIDEAYAALSDRRLLAGALGLGHELPDAIVQRAIDHHQKLVWLYREDKFAGARINNPQASSMSHETSGCGFRPKWCRKPRPGCRQKSLKTHW
jgi:hypothetical protein